MGWGAWTRGSGIQGKGFGEVDRIAGLRGQTDWSPKAPFLGTRAKAGGGCHGDERQVRVGV